MQLSIGPFVVDPPVVLAPMAGITNVAFRQLCRERMAMAGAAGARRPLPDRPLPDRPLSDHPSDRPSDHPSDRVARGLFVCEMVTTRALLERHAKTMRMVTFAADEYPRSLQLYGIDPAVVGQAVTMVAEESLADHIDLNFGCPVPKVTRKGGGSALPWRWRLFQRIVAAAVTAAGPAGIPVTVKLRKGIDDQHLTYRRAGLIAQEAGAAAVALHGRTAAQGYSGAADWSAVAELKQALDIPVLGNGDIWEAADARRLVRRTGADGVVIGRGSLGRPWLFSDLAAVFTGDGAERALPNLGEVATMLRRHAELLVDWLGDEPWGCAELRKHVAWYFKGFPVGGELRRRLAMVSSLAELDGLVAELDPAVPFPVRTVGQPRGRTSAPARVILPEGWLADPDADAVPLGAE